MPELSITLNDCHIAVLDDETRFLVLNAGRGFGKTQLILARIFKHLQRPYTDAHGVSLPHKVWYIAPTYKQGKMIFWQRLREFFKPMIAAKNESELTLRLVTGAEIRVVGSEQWDNLRGAYLTLAIFDEFAFHKPNYWTRVIRPMLGRVSPLGSADFMSTPDGHNEFYQLFQHGHDASKPDWASYHFTSLEGGFIPVEEIEAAKYEMTLEEWRQEYFGEFIAQAGRVYYKFDRLKHCKPVKHVPGLELHWFWDFNEVPSCHSGLAHVHKGRVYVFDEIAVGNTVACVEAFFERYPKASLQDPETGQLPKITIYGDCTGDRATSGVSDYLMMADMLAQAGYGVPEVKVMTANPLVKDRTNAVNVKLLNAAGDVGIVVNDKACPKLVTDFEQVKRTDAGDIDKTTDRRLSHISDALGYMVYTLFPVKSPERRAMERATKRDTMAGGYWV